MNDNNGLVLFFLAGIWTWLMLIWFDVIDIKEHFVKSPEQQREQIIDQMEEFSK